MNANANIRPILMLPQIVLIWFVIYAGLAGFLSISNGIQLTNSSTYCLDSCFTHLLVGSFYSLITACILSAIVAIILFSVGAFLLRYELQFMAWFCIIFGTILGIAVAEAAKFLISQTNLITTFFSSVATNLSIPTGLFSAVLGLLIHFSFFTQLKEQHHS